MFGVLGAMLAKKRANERLERLKRAHELARNIEKANARIANMDIGDVVFVSPLVPVFHLRFPDDDFFVLSHKGSPTRVERVLKGAKRVCRFPNYKPSRQVLVDYDGVCTNAAPE